MIRGFNYFYCVCAPCKILLNDLIVSQHNYTNHWTVLVWSGGITVAHNGSWDRIQFICDVLTLPIGIPFSKRKKDRENRSKEIKAFYLFKTAEAFPIFFKAFEFFMSTNEHSMDYLENISMTLQIIGQQVLLRSFQFE